MDTVRRLSLPFVQPLARLFSNEELEGERRASVTPRSASASNPPSALTQVTSNPVPSAYQADADLPLLLQDAVYHYQLSSPKPLSLSPVAFHTADIVWRYKDSGRVYNILQKKGIITPEGGIKTIAITNKFSHYFAFLSAFAQRRVIGLLFWWEEEEQRLKKLYEQEHDICEALKEADEHQDRAMLGLLKVELERTRMLIKQRPSGRHDDTASSRQREQLPAYAPAPRGSSREHLPPTYTEDPATYLPG